jgi:hypothetical protein
MAPRAKYLLVVDSELVPKHFKSTHISNGISSALRTSSGLSFPAFARPPKSFYTAIPTNSIDLHF